MTCKVIKSYERVKKKYKESIARDPALKNKWGLNPRHLIFTMHYADSASPGFLNGAVSARLAGYKGKRSISVQSHQLLRSPKVIMALKELLGTDRIDTLIQSGVEKRLADPDSRNWMSTADFVAKVRGDFAPTQSVNMNLTPEDRDKKYQDIINLVERKNKELKSTTETVYEMPESTGSTGG